MKIVWLASYPKSGNTFIRMLLHDYLFGELQDSEELERRIPDLHRLLSDNKALDIHSDQQTIVKTHFCFSDKRCAIDKARAFEIEEKKHGRKSIFDLPKNATSFVGAGKTSQSLDFIGEDVDALYQERFGKLVHIFEY